ncbi:hypothetical protein CMO90_03315 [Candidatus Woesearchaeota archaeon]|nr:hypothetical protein [Candidatus Woesearchaeota archaeon]|tara:strand:+ start:2492 stop:3148 length:657 start_codon:yes stop_codon:yes gene_type:complete
MTEKILIVAAHSDDQIIGVGGTAAKYVLEGLSVHTIIFSQGEISHPHFQENIIVRTREKESLQADKIIGGEKIHFLRLAEKHAGKEEELLKAKNKLKTLIKNLKPIKIFTHSKQDPHPLHKITSTIVLDIADELPFKTEVYTFDIWNTFRWDKKKHHQLAVDISQTFDKKIRALKCFKSQFNVQGFMNFLPLITMYLKNFWNGLTHHTKYVEIFYKEK